MSFKSWAVTKEIENNWEGTGLLEGAIDKTATAMLLEGQKIYNEASGSVSVKFNRISIPLAVRVSAGMNEVALLGSTLELPNWYTFKDIKMTDGKQSLDEEAKMCAELADELSEAVKGLAKSKKSDYIAVHCFALNPDNTVKINYSVD